MAQDLKRFLESLCDLWQKQVAVCKEAKARDFDAAANAVMQYVGKKYKSIKIVDDEEGAGQQVVEPVCIMNYTQAFIDIMTPYIFASVPNRLVSPRAPQIPPELEHLMPDVVAMQAAIKKRDTLLSWLQQIALNYFPDLYGLTREGKMAVEEALGKGRGVLWLEMIDSPIGPIPASNADSVDHLLIDADARQLRDAGFIIRRREMPCYRIAELWGEDVKKVRGTDKSAMADAQERSGHREKDQEGDIGVYYEIWSVIGMGHKLVSAPEEMQEASPLLDALEQLGPYVHFAVMPGLDHPLGMDPETMTAVGSPEEFLARLAAMLEWPIKTYENPDNPWPMKPLDFKPQVDKPWPRPILEAALPLQEFIDTVYQALLHRAHVAGRDIILCSTEVEEALEKALEKGRDLEIAKLNEKVDSETMEKLVGFLRFPEMKKDILEILELANRAFRELTGLDPAMFGGIPKAQDRSAEATQVREAGLARRPDDYADTTEQWMSDVGSGEGVAARMLLAPETVSQIMREPVTEAETLEGQVIYGPLTEAWFGIVATEDPAIAACECAYTVEAGSGRRRNKQLLQQNAQQLHQMLAQQFYEVGAATGQWDPFIALVRLIGDAFDMPVEPLIEKFTEAMAQMQQAQAMGQPPEAEGEQQPTEEPATA